MRVTYPLLFKGCAPGTHWHSVGDLRLNTTTGFVTGGGFGTSADAVAHITGQSHPSPFLSCSTSFAVARGYAVAGQRPATRSDPGWVYVLDLNRAAQMANQPIPTVVDPISLLAGTAHPPFAHEHTGDQSFVFELGGLSPTPTLTPVAWLNDPNGTSHPPTHGTPLRALIYALRDAEVFVVGHIPPALIQRRIDVY